MRTASATVSFEIPARSGEVLCVPPASQLLVVAEANRRALQAASTPVGGVSVGNIRAEMRRAVLAATSAYGEELRLPPLSEADPRPLVGTGHQPVLFHPGIWVKQLLGARLASAAAVVNMAVDCDAAAEVGADAPHLDGGLRIVRETLRRTDPEVPYEATAAPDPGEWAAFLERLDAHLRTLPHRLTRETFAEFRARTADLQAREIGSFLTLARRRHEGEAAYAELPVSRLSDLRGFRLFVLHLITEAERFSAVFNARLAAYRELNNIRTAGQPFPGLGRDGPRFEVPFWIIHRGCRRRMYVDRFGGAYRLWAEAQQVAAIAGRDPDELAGLAVRPRALTLTLFTRLCVVDLFIHGVGGGRYDRMTDEVIREFFGLEPPRYAVVSATLHLPLGELDPDLERAVLQRRHLELLHNPERALGDPTEEQRRWIEEKWQWIRRLDEGHLTRRERREATRRIRTINQHLGRALAEERRRIEERLAALAGVGRAFAAATYRGYPFCFFPRPEVEALVDRMFAEPQA
ncbi:MAG: hypothetical protein QN141_06435 [Armatimonadota bacterium]|nr:hypothetical protein [Armatimonadota bacterium]MDR7452349.1 hypothetical protein [Armatimonadota bacterium]MDR7466909.1 hypothetical protein [Armatimonadota bacterium]MDR7493549.1 hypothetical protein [Armatimonadota bacterium]MDR7498814.1 hypothetical protein [Armatimonadota bacterium]